MSGMTRGFCRWLIAVALFAIFLSGQVLASEGASAASIVHSSLEYPPSAVDAGEQGTATVRALVEATGRASHITIETSSGYPDLDAAAVRSVSQWTFKPAMKSGKPEASWVRVPLAFQLNEPPGEGGPDMGRVMQTLSSVVVGYLGVAVWFVGFIWSWILAKRSSRLWLSGMVALWLFTYPAFVATHWTASKRNLAVVVIGLSLVGLGLAMAPSVHH
ncbi:energy transducer TonB [Luteibacter pinisoli]|uniref:Energy transducer TonB n=1 Tax=Luteibacter pinisoli TaxID=2589080 RepID=A0A4Y5Z335_9GAMM|nr:energy transducer TonB [Luteibacter pinisoli]QDE39454.1 energy transducer TonB [Luteibacter pinisoli]